jgi:flagellar M-ring protein FliF
MEFITRVFNQIVTFFASLTPIRKVSVVILGGGVMGGLVLLGIWAGDRTYVPLMSNLNPEDSASVIRVLREKNLSFRVDQGGRTILVSPENLDILRLELATQGYPLNSVVGYEVFDKTSLSTTSFIQKVNQKRALEGELMRTINTISGVKRSRVHLAIPQKSTFVEDSKKPTASVVLDLAPGTSLHERQITGIGTLVARAVEGLDPNEVVIVDNQGRTLSKNSADSLGQLTSTQLDYKTKVEREMETRVEQMLGRVVGEGRVIARVTTDLDFSSFSETQTTYDADGSAVKSVNESQKSQEGNRPTPAGVPGAQSNTPGDPARANVIKTSDTKTSDKTVNYSVPSTVRNVTKSPGALKKLSVAVVIDGKRVKTTTAEGKVESKVEAWSEDQLKEFEGLVASALGVDRKRGDTLQIKNMEFREEDFAEAEQVLREKEQKTYFQNLILYGVIGLTIALFFFLVVRPFIKWVTENTTDSVDSFLPQTLEELEKIQKNSTLPGLEDAIPVLPDRVDPEKVEGEMIREKIITLVDTNPHKAALILREWLTGSQQPPKGKGGDGDEKSA